MHMQQVMSLHDQRQSGVRFGGVTVVLLGGKTKTDVNDGLDAGE